MRSPDRPSRARSEAGGDVAQSVGEGLVAVHRERGQVASAVEPEVEVGRGAFDGGVRRFVDRVERVEVVLGARLG